MAKTVGDLLIKLGVDGLGGVTALKSALRTLGQASKSSDKQLEGLRREIVEVAKAAKISRQSIRGQIDAFKGLRQQATIGSTVYKKLGKDIDSLTQSLDKLNRKEEEASKKPRTAKQIFGTESVAVVPEKFTRQIAAGNELLQKIGVTSAEYATQLAAVTARTQEFSRAQQRQQVIAQNLVATNRAQTTGFLQSTRVNIENTHTTAALKQKIAELTQDLDNIDVGSKEYITTSNRLKDAQEELNVVLGISSKAFDELSRAQERAERRAAKLADIQQYYGTSRTGEGQAAQRAGGFRDPATGAMIARGTRRGRVSLAQQPVREISDLYRSIGDIGMSGISADIDRMGKSYEEVTQDIREATLASNGSINSLQSQRASWASLRAGLSPTSKAYQDVGREIEKVDRQLEKLNKRRRRPTLGGAASMLGGIAAGGVFGGPEGAVGGAIGGVVGGVAGVAAGAALGAQVKMLREALGATSDYAAGLQKLEIALEGVAGARYTDALKVAANVTRDFNVPLDVSTKGITRLSAAVLGAGGNLDDAEVVFRNVTAAIKATGGGAQDVESAITAMVQTFSKGKVSAEELSGQLGERLPGAVTKFADANDMTLPQLQQAFKAGTVGLDQLMKFIISLGPAYEETARKIADSSADAGAKSAVAFDEVRREIGEALQPIGADLQKAFAEFALEVLPAVKAAAVAAAAGMDGLMKATAVLINNLKEIAIVAGVAGAVGAFLNLGKIIAALKVAVFDLKLAFAVLTKTMLLNPFIALAAGATAAAIALHKATTANKRFNKSVIKGEVSNEQANDRLREMNDKVKELEARLEKETNNRMIQSLTRQLKAAKVAAGDLELAMKLASSYEVAGVKYDRMTGRPIDAPSLYTPHDYDDPTAGGDGAGGGKGSAPMSDVELTLRRQMREEIEKQNRIKQSLIQLDLDLLAAAEEIEGTNKRINLEEQARHDHNQRLNKIFEDGKKIFEDQQKLRKDAVVLVREAQIAASGLSKEEMGQVEIMRQLAAFAEKFKDALTDEEMVGFLKALRDALQQTQESAENTGETFDEVFEKGLKEMIEIGPQLANVALGAINSVTDGIVELITTGKANFTEMAASILKDLAKIMIRAAIVKAITSAFGINLAAANGAVLEGGRVKKYAKGGVVGGPTFFPMAGGQVGLMGEAGPEAIMPLKRGSDGKLGVTVNDSDMSASMSRYSAGARAKSAALGGGSAGGGYGSAMDGGTVVNYNGPTLNFNSEDYVPASAVSGIIDEAARRGAKAGEQRTFASLQNSRSRRGRIGLGR